MTNNTQETWREEFENKWNECNCNGGWDYGQCNPEGMYATGHEGCSEDMVKFIAEKIEQAITRTRLEVKGDIHIARKQELLFSAVCITPEEQKQRDAMIRGFQAGEEAMRKEILALPSLQITD